MAKLKLGPVQRYAGETEATVWVETEGACEVEVLGHRSRTFCVAGHHYAIVVLEGLEPGTSSPYTVRLDGIEVWPEPGERQGVIRTRSADDRLRLAFGTCRVAVPNVPPYTNSEDLDPRGKGVDSLVALSERMKKTPDRQWPDALLLIGDQVYADVVSPGVAERIERRRSTEEGAGEEIADFEEYTWLYEESWGQPEVRWVLASLPSAMIFDDHDVTDDWNISGSWINDQRKKEWWRERLLGAYMSYWIYQHLGNLSPGELREDPTLRALRENDGDGEEIMREYAATAADQVAATRWSFSRDFGRNRLIVLDSRAGRIVDDDSRRQMLSDEQWRWVSGEMEGDFDHLMIASSVPILMSQGLHYLEGWNEAVCAGAWGRRARKPAEAMRQMIDLEHWPAFRQCFDRLMEEVEQIGDARRERLPASVILLSGDVHHAYVAEAEFPASSDFRPAFVQAVCSPIRNPLPFYERGFMKAALSRTGRSIGHFLARSAKVPATRLRWEFIAPPTFDNQIGTVHIEGRGARITIERTSPDDWREPGLTTSLDYTVTAW
jgi:phosphodiesterase/alkaline phosphatase D-like protein